MIKKVIFYFFIILFFSHCGEDKPKKHNAQKNEKMALSNNLKINVTHEWLVGPNFNPMINDELKIVFQNSLDNSPLNVDLFEVIEIRMASCCRSLVMGTPQVEALNSSEFKVNGFNLNKTGDWEITYKVVIFGTTYTQKYKLTV